MGWTSFFACLVQSHGGIETSHLRIFTAYARDSCPSKSRGQGQPRWDGAGCAHEGRKERPLPARGSKIGAPVGGRRGWAALQASGVEAGLKAGVLIWDYPDFFFQLKY